MKFLKDSGIAIAVTILLFAALEIGLRLFFPQNARITLLSGEKLGMPDSLLGHVNCPNNRARIETPEFAAEYQINAEGMRDQTSHPIPKPAGLLRILLVGDSFTFGMCNQYDDIWPVLLEQELLASGHRVDVVKAGVPGYDTRREGLMLERLVPRYRPDLVILTFLPHDLFANAISEPSGNRATVSQEKKDARPRSLGMQSHLLILFKRLIRANDFLYSRLYMVTKRVRTSIVAGNDELIAQIAATRDQLDRAATFCNLHEARFVVLSIPEQFQVLVQANRYQIPTVDVEFVDREFGEMAHQTGFDWLPVLPMFTENYRATGQDQYYRFDGHLNPEGNRQIADWLARQLDMILDGAETSAETNRSQVQAR